MRLTNRAGRRIDAIYRAFGLVASSFGGWLSGCCRLPFFGGCSVGGMAETADRRLEVALGIDQEVGGDHHLFAFLDPLQHFDVIVAARPEFDIARLEAAFALLDQHYLAGTAVDYGGGRHGDDLAFCAHRQFDLGEHGRLEQQTRIGQFDANRHGTGLRIQCRIDIADRAFESLARIGIDHDLGLGSGLDEADILFENIGDDPH